MILLAIPFEYGYAHDGGPADLASLDYIQKPGAQVPLDLNFRSESGAELRLGDLFTGEPVVLLFGYYNCPTLCGIAMEDLARAVDNTRLSLGTEFRIVTISIDTAETPEHASAKKLELKRLIAAPAEMDSSWSFLTGSHASIDRLAEAVGFRYAYDEESGQFMHPAGVVVLTPEATVSRYITGIGYDSNSLRLAVVEASNNKIGGVSDQIRLLCYRYDEATGRYTLALSRLLQVGSIGMVGVTAAAILLLERKRRQEERNR